MEKRETKVKVISESFMKPLNPQVVDEVSKKEIIYLNPYDLALLNFSYMRKGLLFAKTSENAVEFLLQKLKHSLSLALHHFYPLAGRFDTQTYPDEHACCIFLDCSKGHGARFIHASLLDSSITVSDILTSPDIHPLVTSFFDLGEKAFNHDGLTKPLLSFQVTELVDGIFIGISMNHSVGDGSSFLHFITSLSEIFNSVVDDNISKKPIFNPLLPEGYGPILKLPFTKPDEFIYRDDDPTCVPLRQKIFHFSAESMSRLKSIANNSKFHEIEISSFKALAGLVWRAVTRARKPDPEMETTCNLPVDFRRLLIPPVSQQVFGNYFTGVSAKCKAGDLLRNDLGYGASLIDESVKNMNDGKIKSILRFLCKNPVVVKPDSANESSLGNNSLHIGWSPRFDLFGIEFGMGRPVAIRSGYSRVADGVVDATQGRQGVGSVDLEVCFVSSTMSALEVDQEFMSFATVDC